MSASALSCLIFVSTLGGILLGTLLRRALPEHHLSKDSQDVVRLGVGLIATITAGTESRLLLSDDIKELVATDVFLATTHER
jgi:hypothetical protein